MATSPITLEQIVALNDEIAALVRAGVPLELGLREMGNQSSDAMAEISRALAARMEKGVSLGDALRAEEERLPAVYRTVVEAGLRAGRLPVALEAMSNFARELIELRRQISTAMVYPLIVFALAYSLFLVFTVDLLERFRETYELLRIPMHGGLRWLVWIAERVDDWWWAPPVLVIALMLWWRGTRGAHVLSFTGTARPFGWIPGIGRIGRYFQCANFAELLAMLIEHDVPLAEGLRLSAEATGDRRMKWAAAQMAEAIARGEQAPATSFPPFLDWVLRQAARGGNPVRILRHAAGFYRRRAVSLASWFKVTFPLLGAVVIGGGITAVYALALFGPLATFWKDILLEH